MIQWGGETMILLPYDAYTIHTHLYMMTWCLVCKPYDDVPDRPIDDDDVQ